MNLRKLARRVAHSRFLAKGRALWEANQTNWNLPLSKLEKLQVGLHLILADYAEGRFPPTFEDQRKTYDGEINYRSTIPSDPQTSSEGELRKPYWFGASARNYLTALVTLIQDFERLGIRPPQRLLELGSGAGWMAEAVARLGFQVVGTSIAPDDIQDANKRIAGLRATGLPVDLEFRVAAMESVHEAVQDRIPFDAVWVFQALHHAYDWRATMASAFQCLKPGGWLIIACEPNLIHTFVSYRIGRLSNTHEIGMSRAKMCKHLRALGFSKVVILHNWLHGYVRSHWIGARR